MLDTLWRPTLVAFFFFFFATKKSLQKFLPLSKNNIYCAQYFYLAQMSSSLNEMRIDMLEKQVCMLQEKFNFLLKEYIKTSEAKGQHPVPLAGTAVTAAATSPQPSIVIEKVQRHSNARILQEASEKLAIEKIVAADKKTCAAEQQTSAAKFADIVKAAVKQQSGFNGAAATKNKFTMEDLFKKAVEYTPEMHSAKAFSDNELISIQQAKQKRARMDHRNFLAEIWTLAKKDESSGRILLHGGQIPHFVWPLDRDGNAYEGYVIISGL